MNSERIARSENSLGAPKPLKGHALVRAAKQLAEAAHAGQFRDDGKTPYITHPTEVVARIRGDSTDRAIGWLHDVLEHTHVRVPDLKKAGFSDEVIKGVIRLSHLSKTSYRKYLVKVKAEPRTRKIKIADMLSNLRESKERADILKYSEGLLYLLTAL
jgi:guanosine-3',5'-bis(diphosphate) 3'-pyrophosphohydrolase